MRHTKRDLRERLRGGATPGATAVRALVRRLRVVASAGVHWALEGHEDADGNVESDDVEVFPGVGLYARAKASHRVEAIAVKVGGADHPVIVATRNQDGIKILGDLEEDEAAIFTSVAMVKIKANGEVLIGSIDGTFAALAKADHTHDTSALTAGGDSVVGALGASSSNTTTLRAE